MMGEKTGIAWTDHTFNPWIGCQKISEGCRNCYAARDNNRYQWVNEWGKDYRRTSEQNWKKPIQWANKATKDWTIRRVFCASLADVFDPNVPQEWREDLWDLIRSTAFIEETEIHSAGLEWLILTKRPENIRKMLPLEWQDYPPYYIRMGVTAENQEMADKRILILLGSWSGKNFLSYEPAIGPLDLWGAKYDNPNGGKTGAITSWPGMIQWLICGAESGPAARPMDIEWARSVRDQCVAANVPFFLKQMVVDGKLNVLPELDGKVWDQFPKDD